MPQGKEPIRVGEAQRLIREYRRATGDLAGPNDLTLPFVEAGTALAADFGFGDERFFPSLERAIESIVGALGELEAAPRERSVTRLRQIANRANVIGWGYGDYVQDVVENLP